MRRPIILYFSSIIALILVNGCFSPFSYTPPESQWDLDAKGTLLYAYIDENYQISENNTDTGKLAVIIDNNSLAEGVMAVSQTATEDNDEAVYLSNQNTNTVIAVFFRSGQRFPWLIDIDSGGKRATARLFGYEWGREQFSLEFEEGGVKTAMKDIKLSPSVLMTAGDIRLRNMYTALGVYESISREFPSVRPFQVQDAGNALSSVFNDTAYVAFAVTVKPAKAIISIDEYVGGKEPSLGFISWVKGLFGWGESSSKPSPPSPPPSLAVAITRRDNGATIGPDTVLYIEKGEELIIDFKFTNFTQNTNVQSVFYHNVLNPVYFPESWGNGAPYTITQANGFPLGRLTENYSIKIKRGMIEGPGFGDGIAGFVLFFGQNTVINNSSNGIQFWEPGTGGPQLNHSVFLIKYSVQKEQEKS